MYLRATGYKDAEYDACGNTTIGIIEIDNIKIPLCFDCLEELKRSISEFDATIFCHQCEFFIMSNSGWKYGGSCLKQAQLKGKTITKENAGYEFCTNCMNTCKYAKARIESKVKE